MGVTCHPVATETERLRFEFAGGIDPEAEPMDP
jgi:hypothetical protein